MVPEALHGLFLWLALGLSYGSTYLEKTGYPSHIIGCGVGRRLSGAPSPSAWPLLATNASRGPVTHCWLHLDMCHPVPGPERRGGGGWVGVRIVACTKLGSPYVLPLPSHLLGGTQAKGD